MGKWQTYKVRLIERVKSIRKERIIHRHPAIRPHDIDLLPLHAHGKNAIRVDARRGPVPVRHAECVEGVFVPLLRVAGGKLCDGCATADVQRLLLLVSIIEGWEDSGRCTSKRAR